MDVRYKVLTNGNVLLNEACNVQWKFSQVMLWHLHNPVKVKWLRCGHKGIVGSIKVLIVASCSETSPCVVIVTTELAVSASVYTLLCSGLCESLIFHADTLHYSHIISNCCTFLQSTELIIYKRISLVQKSIIHFLKTSLGVQCSLFDGGLKWNPTNLWVNCRCNWCAYYWD